MSVRVKYLNILELVEEGTPIDDIIINSALRLEIYIYMYIYIIYNLYIYHIYKIIVIRPSVHPLQKVSRSDLTSRPKRLYIWPSGIRS